MFDITAQDISQLNDADLRELITKLCQADAQKANFSNSVVTWGGAQTATDGGIDVRVQPKNGQFKLLDNHQTPCGIQVKKDHMPRGDILNEMAPKGSLRESIQTLLKNHGTYIIASAVSASDTMLKNRTQAMKDALASHPHLPPNVVFLDASQISSWVEDHPALKTWIRAKLNKPVEGWQEWGAWTGSTASPRSHSGQIIRGGDAHPYPRRRDRGGGGTLFPVIPRQG